MPAHKNRRILVIDDVAEIHGDFRQALCPAGTLEAQLPGQDAAASGQTCLAAVGHAFQVERASTGQEGLAMVHHALQAQRPYALAFVAAQLSPGWDGIETILNLWCADPFLQIVLCSARADCSMAELTARVPQTDQFLILRKPFDPVEARQLALTLTEKWRLRDQAKFSQAQLDDLVREQTAVLERAKSDLRRQLRESEQSRNGLEEANRRIAEGHSQLIQTEKLAAIGQLISGVAHEINNPLGCVMSNIEMLQRHAGVLHGLCAAGEQAALAARDNDQAALDAALGELARLQGARDARFILQELSGLISDSSEALQRIAEIVRSLRSFARSDTGKMTACDVNEGLEATLRLMACELRAKCEIDKQLRPVPRVWGCPGQLNQVFMHLLANAAEAIRDHGAITVSTEAAASEVVIRIADTGAGIPAENLPKLFTPLFTCRPAGKGTGLGLSTAYGIVRQHGGRIQVESQPGRGTTFTIRLPQAAQVKTGDGAATILGRAE